MNAERPTLILHVLAPAVIGEEKRTLSVVHAIERGMPGVRLAWTISDEGEVLPVADNVRGSRREPDGRFLLLCNADLENLVTLARREIPAELCPGGQAKFFVYADWPMDAPGLTAAAEVLEGVAEAAQSYWAHVTPRSVMPEIADQASDSASGPAQSPRGLPMVKRPWQIPVPTIPGHLGWLNYWSAAAARAIGFPDPALDAELLSRSRRTTTGGWVVRLTDAPLDLDNPAHLDALLRAYERFPVIGGRATP